MVAYSVSAPQSGPTVIMSVIHCTHSRSMAAQCQYSTIRVQSHNVCHTLHTQSVIHCTHSSSVVAHDVCGLELERVKSMPHGQSAQSLSGITHNRSVAIHSQGCISYLDCGWPLTCHTTGTYISTFVYV